MERSLLTQVLESPLSDLPGVVVDLLEVCDRPDASVAEVAEAIERAPGIAVRLLRFANSADVGRVGRTATILDATAVVGLDLVRTIAVGEAIASKFNAHNPVTAVVRGRCLLAAAAARVLTLDKGRQASDRALLAGLLALIGELAAGEHRPDLVGPMLSRRDSFDPDHERQVLGHSGPEISGRVLRRWRLPSVIVDAVEGRDGASSRPTPLGRTVRRAVLLAELLGAGNNPTRDELDQLGLTYDEYDLVLTELAELTPSLAPITGEAEYRLIRMISTTRASILLRALNLEPSGNRISARPSPTTKDIDPLTGLPNAAAIARYALALDEFVARSRANNPTTPSVGAILFHIESATEPAEHHTDEGEATPTTALADLLGNQVRSNEFLGCLSPHDFIVVAPATSATELAGALARFEGLIEGLSVVVDGESVELGVRIVTVLDDVAEALRQTMVGPKSATTTG